MDQRNPPSPQKRILVVEDDPSVRLVTQTALRQAGYFCTVCVDGDQAIERMKRESYDLLITDYLLPGPNGIDVVRWAQSQKGSAKSIVITGYPSEELKKQCNELGVARLLVKPEYNAVSLPAVVKEVLGS